MENLQKAKQLCKKYKQEKILKELDKNENPELIEQILKIDFEKIENCKEKIGREELYKEEKIEKNSYIDGNTLNKEEKEHYEKIGKSIISKGKYAVVTMAGGQRNKARSHRSKRHLLNRCKA